MASISHDERSLFNFIVKDGNGVKGLVDTGLTEVPDWFIQLPHNRLDKQQTAASPENLIIDLSDLDGPNHDQVVKTITHAAETQGFFQVVNHGVPLEVLESLKAAAHQFFGQPAEKKAAYLKEVSPSPLIKYGTSYDPEKEKILMWRDFLNLRYTDDAAANEFWPNDCKEVALEYMKTSKEMVKKLLKLLIENLGVVNLDDSKLDRFLGFTTVNMNFYPACPNPDLTVGMSPHSDYGTLTVLLQDGIGGLYMNKGETSSPEWIEVPPVPGALVINVGDTLQILSNGKYKSAEHRVGTTSIASRVSLPILTGPLPVEKIGPLPEVVARDGVARYRELIFIDYMNNLFQNAPGGKKGLDFASI